MRLEGDKEDLSLKELKKLKRLKFLSPVKKLKIEKYQDSEKDEIKPSLVEVLNKYSLCACGNIGFNLIKKFKGFGFFQGVVIVMKK